MSASIFHTRSSRLAPAVLAPLGVGIAVVAGGFWLSLPELAVMRSAGVAVDEVAAITAAPPITEGGREAVDRTALGGSLLFGVAELTANAADADGADRDEPGVVAGDAAPAELPVAALSVSVQGIVFDPDSASGRVIFGGAGGEMRSYRVGDSLPDGVTIRFIEAQRVVVEQAGELKALPLPSPHGGTPLLREPPAAADFDAVVMPDDSSYEEEYDLDSLEPEYE